MAIERGTEADASEKDQGGYADRKRGRRPPGWLIALVIAILAGVLAGWLSMLREAPRVRRWMVLPSDDLHFDPVHGAPQLSPDGTRIAYVAESIDGERTIWIQSVGALEARSLAGTEGASHPFWSPDGTSIAYFATKLLLKVPVEGGPVQTITESASNRGGSWGTSGTILFTPSVTGVIHAVAESGGEPRPVTELDESRGETSHRLPHFLPDGKHFLYLTQGKERPDSDEGFAVFAGSIDSMDRTMVVATSSSAWYATSGHLLFLRNQNLMAQRFDPVTLRLSGDPVFVAPDIGRTFHFEATFSASENGTLLFQSKQVEISRLTWMDRDGVENDTIGKPADHSAVVLSHDGRRVATAIADPETGKSDIWVIDLERGTSARLTFDVGDDFAPVWSSDDSSLYFYSERSDLPGTYVMSVEGNEEVTLVHASDVWHLLWCISPDGKTGWIIRNNFPRGTQWDIERLDLATGESEPFQNTASSESGPAISPDGAWLAYHSDAAGQTDVYVASTQNDGPPLRISTDGGSHASWTRGGHELIYRNPSGVLMSVSVRADPTFSFDPPVPLFDARERDTFGLQYSVTSDGTRFLVNQQSDQQSANPFVLIENWALELERK